MEPKWLIVDHKNFDKPQQKTLGGVLVNVYFSPLDVPVAVRGRYDEGIDRFLIEFKYDRNEPRSESTIEERKGDVVLRVGCHSKRLYSVGLDVNQLKAEVVGLQLHKPALPESLPALPKSLSSALDSLANAPTYRHRGGNYSAAKKAISSQREELFRALQEA